MILAINLNAALDRVFFIERFEPETHIRCLKSDLYVGGKGLDTALVLHTILAKVKVISFIAGDNGKALEGLLIKYGIPHELLWVPGETRVANIIVETAQNRHTHITTYGYQLCEEDCQKLLETIKKHRHYKWGVMSGSIPVGADAQIYARIIHEMHNLGMRSLIDNTGTPLLIALTASPDVVKMNDSEFNSTFQTKINWSKNWVEQIQSIISLFKIKSLVITRGKAGITAFTPEGVFQSGCSEKIIEVNAAGAGDAVSAAVVHHLSNGVPWSEVIRWGAATGAAVALTEGTAVCQLPDVNRLYHQTWVKRIDL